MSENRAVGKVKPDYQADGVTLYLGDCLEKMYAIEDSSVDAIIADLPYGTTACKWDSVIPFEPLWKHFKRVLKPRGAVVLFGSQPFTSALVNSNWEGFKYCWYWDKITGKGHLNAKVQPMRQVEEIAVFGNGRINYYPQMTKRNIPKRVMQGSQSETTRKASNFQEHITETYYPKTLLRYSVVHPAKCVHPTQKPVALLEYLIRTYTNPGDTVLDCVMGSGTTGHAAVNLNRRFIGIEKEPKYFNIARDRIAKAQTEPRQLELIK